MANPKSTRSRKRRKAVPFSRLIKFPEVKGKTIHEVEIDPEGMAIVMLFQDNTALSFDLDPRLGIFPELSDRRAGDWRSLKRWEPVHTKSSIHKWL
jgi:hypothetical protein